MGLDIYLYTRAQAEANKIAEAASEAFYDDAHYDKLTEEQREAGHKALPKFDHQVDVPSERYPEHLFNRRYLRSSYNGSGFNNIVPKLLGDDDSDLAWIFEPVRLEDQYDIELTSASIDSLRHAKARALEVAVRLRTCDRLTTATAEPNIFSAPPTHTAADALALYRKAVAEERINADSWWSNSDMDMFGPGMTVLAAVPGRGVLGVPAVHLVFRLADEGYESYIQSAEITAEFCDEAIGLIERDGSCSMSWSG